MAEIELLDRLSSIVDELGGKIEKYSTYDMSGRTSKKIIIEYDVKDKKELHLVITLLEQQQMNLMRHRMKPIIHNQ